MRTGLRYLWRIVFLMLLALALKSQNLPGLHLKLNNAGFDELVREIESKTDYYFYYDSSETDSLLINLDASNQTVPQILETVFENTGFHYSIDEAHRIFVNKKFLIATRLPEINTQSKAGGSRDTAVSYNEMDADKLNKGKLKVPVENRIFEIGQKSGNPGNGKAALGGYVRDARSGEPIAGCTLFVDSLRMAISTDQYGYYSVTLPRGRHMLHISYAGMKATRRQIILNSDGKLDIELQEYIASLKEVIVSAEKQSNTRSAQMGVNKLNIKAIRQVPVVFGEADVLKVVLALPGVTSVGEAANGFNVRGGSTDQNLILFNDATIYNPTHLFGFFSAFNPDVVKGIELYKSAIPEKYGGRISSVLDVTTQDGNSRKWSGVAGIGPLTGNIMIEGPLQKDKTTVIAAFRTTYSNWLLKIIPNDAYKNSKADFYDANLHISHIINPKNTLYLTGYLSSDGFNLHLDTSYRYGNSNLYLKWKHLFSNISFVTVTAGLDHYSYSIAGTNNPVNAFKLGFGIDQRTFRSDFTYIPNSNHTITYGLNAVYYKLQPGSFEPGSSVSLVTPDVVPNEQGLESALFLGDQYRMGSKWLLDAGIRYSMFNYLGPHTVNRYEPGVPRDTTTIIASTYYGPGRIIKTYSAPEIRLGLRYTISDNSSLKINYNTLQQYIHMLSNTVSISPTDVWKLSDPNIKPQQGQQISLGYYQNFKSNSVETSVEVYYKKLKNYMDYKAGAQLLLNSHIETDVINTQGKAYGIEFLVKKTLGQLNGWISYTYSRTFLKQDDPNAGQTINNGDYYPASFDKPHNFNFIGNYRFSHRYNLSVNLVYNTGRPITLPIAVFNRGNTIGLIYSERNQYRIPDYFRTDVSFTMDGNHKVKQKIHNSWSFGIYNLTGRQNVYSVYYIVQNGKVQGYQLSIFGTLIPFVTLTLKF